MMMKIDKVKIIVCTICAILFYFNYFNFVSNIDDSHNKNNVDVKSPPKHPWLRSTDLIYNGERNTVPIVNEEYRIVFFLTAKVASTEFIRFFTRLQRDNPNWCKPNIHHANVHKLKLLNDFSLDEAQDIMTSSNYTRVIFVRDPKPRLLSAFLDKAVQYSERFVKGDKDGKGSYCKTFMNKGGDFDECVEKHQQFDFFLKKFTTTEGLAEDVHWRSIYSRIDEKWWPYIDKIGYMDTLKSDVKSILSSIHSTIDGVSAWDRIGTSGWSGVKTNINCSINLQSDIPFLGIGDSKHTTSASALDKLKKYYTPELEKFVESRYSDDYRNPFFHFTPTQLYPNGIDEGEEKNGSNYGVTVDTRISKEMEDNQ